MNILHRVTQLSHISYEALDPDRGEAAAWIGRGSRSDADIQQKHRCQMSGNSYPHPNLAANKQHLIHWPYRNNVAYQYIPPPPSDKLLDHIVGIDGCVLIPMWTVTAF